MILSGSIVRRANVVLGNKFYLAAIGVVLSAFFIFGVNRILHSPVFDNEIISQDATRADGNSKLDLNQTPSPAAPATAPSPAATSQGTSSSADTQATVTVDGESITASTNETNPSQSVNKTINTTNGSASVSIQEQSNASSDGTTRSSNRVNVNSSSNSRSNTSFHVSQFNSGGTSP